MHIEKIEDGEYETVQTSYWVTTPAYKGYKGFYVTIEESEKKDTAIAISFNAMGWDENSWKTIPKKINDDSNPVPRIILKDTSIGTTVEYFTGQERVPLRWKLEHRGNLVKWSSATSGYHLKPSQKTVAQYFEEYDIAHPWAATKSDFDAAGIYELMILSDVIDNTLYQNYLLPRIEKEAWEIPPSFAHAARAQLNRDRAPEYLNP